MVHGGCSSVGCYAMTDAGIDQIYAMVEAALGAGQGEVDVHIFPFRMTGEAMLREAGSPGPASGGTSRRLRPLRGEPRAARVGACRGRYVFGDALDDPDCAPITGWRA